MPEYEVDLGQVAKVVRSKNAKPFRLTLDVLFDDPKVFTFIRDRDVLTPEAVAAAYGLRREDVVSNFVFEQGLAFKFTLRRIRSQGELGESDMYGAQQHAPLLTMRVPWNEDLLGPPTRYRAPSYAQS